MPQHTVPYDCPICLKEDDQGAHSGVFGAFDVTFSFDPGQEEVWYPTSRAQPGLPATFDAVVSIEPIGNPCEHAGTEEMEEALVQEIEEDFESGDVWPDEDPVDYAPEWDQNEWEGETS